MSPTSKIRCPDLRNLGLADGKPAVLVIVFRQPGANIISTVDDVRASIPRLKAALPTDLDITFAADRSITIRASLQETELTLVIAIFLVIGVVYVFLRNGRAAAVPAVAVPISIIGTFGVDVSRRILARQPLPDGADHRHRLRGR